MGVPSGTEVALELEAQMAPAEIGLRLVESVQGLQDGFKLARANLKLAEVSFQAD